MKVISAEGTCKNTRTTHLSVRALNEVGEEVAACSTVGLSHGRQLLGKLSSCGFGSAVQCAIIQKLYSLYAMQHHVYTCRFKSYGYPWRHIKFTNLTRFRGTARLNLRLRYTINHV